MCDVTNVNPEVVLLSQHFQALSALYIVHAYMMYSMCHTFALYPPISSTLSDLNPQIPLRCLAGRGKENHMKCIFHNPSPNACSGTQHAHRGEKILFSVPTKLLPLKGDGLCIKVGGDCRRAETMKDTHLLGQ